MDTSPSASRHRSNRATSLRSHTLPCNETKNKFGMYNRGIVGRHNSMHRVTSTTTIFDERWFSCQSHYSQYCTIVLLVCASRGHRAVVPSCVSFYKYPRDLSKPRTPMLTTRSASPSEGEIFQTHRCRNMARTMYKGNIVGRYVVGNVTSVVVQDVIVDTIGRE